MAGSAAWSSGESEPEGDESEIFNFKHVNLEEPGFLSNKKIFYDHYFYPSIKDLIDEVKIDEDIPLKGDERIDYFKLYFDLSLLQMIIEETNRYQLQNVGPERSKMKSWISLTVEEFKKFLGLSILMGHVLKGLLKNYWSTDPLLSTPIFIQMMTRNRYLQILRYLHFQNNEEIINHSLKKIKPIIDDLQEKFSRSIIPGKNLCIDESLLLWKGRLKFKQYIPLERNRFGIKIFELVDCTTGFVLGFVIYTGVDTDYEKFDLGITGDIVAHFLKPYFNKGHILYIDNWYSSPQLAEFLHNHDTGMYGTVKANRKGLPKFNTKLERGEIEAAHNLIWLAMKWKDKKDVYMIISAHELDFCATEKKITSQKKI